MRGKFYIWRGTTSEKESLVHIWVGPDEDLMKNSAWAEQFKEDQIMGAALPETIFDELVVMRFAQLQEEGKVDHVEERAISKSAGNLGCDALSRKHGKPTALEQLEKRTVKVKRNDS
jgi:hypothetical protein